MHLPTSTMRPDRGDRGLWRPTDPDRWNMSSVDAGSRGINQQGPHTNMHFYLITPSLYKTLPFLHSERSYITAETHILHMIVMLFMCTDSTSCTFCHSQDKCSACTLSPRTFISVSSLQRWIQNPCEATEFTSWGQYKIRVDSVCEDCFVST